MGHSVRRRHGERKVFQGGFHWDAETIAIQMFDISLWLPGLKFLLGQEPLVLAKVGH